MQPYQSSRKPLFSHMVRGGTAKNDYQLSKASADRARVNICRLSSANSETKPSASCPASVAASISVCNTTTVAKSALHARHSFSVRPGSSKNFVTRPHMLQPPVNGCATLCKSPPIATSSLSPVTPQPAPHGRKALVRKSRPIC